MQSSGLLQNDLERQDLSRRELSFQILKLNMAAAGLEHEGNAVHATLPFA